MSTVKRSARSTKAPAPSSSRTNTAIKGPAAEEYIKSRFKHGTSTIIAIRSAIKLGDPGAKIPYSLRDIIKSEAFRKLEFSDQFISTWLVYPSGKEIPPTIFTSPVGELPADIPVLEQDLDEWTLQQGLPLETRISSDSFVEMTRLPCLGEYTRTLAAPLTGEFDFDKCRQYRYESDSYIYFLSNRTLFAPDAEMALYHLMKINAELEHIVQYTYSMHFSPSVLQQLEIRYNSLVYSRDCTGVDRVMRRPVVLRIWKDVVCQYIGSVELIVFDDKFMVNPKYGQWFKRSDTPYLGPLEKRLSVYRSQPRPISETTQTSSKPTQNSSKSEEYSQRRRDREAIKEEERRKIRTSIANFLQSTGYPSLEQYLLDQINADVEPGTALRGLSRIIMPMGEWDHYFESDRTHNPVTTKLGLSSEFVKKHLFYASGRNKGKFKYLGDIPSVSFTGLRYLTANLDILTRPGYLVDGSGITANPMTTTSVENSTITPGGGPIITPLPCVLFDNQPLYVPVLRYALRRPESYKEETFCGTYYYFDEGPQLYLKSNKTLIVPNPAHAYFYLNGGDLNAAQLLLENENIKHNTMFTQPITDKPANTPSYDAVKLAQTLQHEMTHCDISRERKSYSEGGHYEQLLCRLARQQGYDLIILTYPFSRKHNSTEIIDVRPRQQSFANLVHRLP